MGVNGDRAFLPLKVGSAKSFTDRLAMESFLPNLGVDVFQALDIEVSKLEEENQKSEERNADLDVSLEQYFGLEKATCFRWIRFKLSMVNFFLNCSDLFCCGLPPDYFFSLYWSRLTLAFKIGSPSTMIVAVVSVDKHFAPE